MKIKEISDQIRRDLWAIDEGEQCGFEQSGTGYDDSNFHTNVIPNMKCKSCGKKASDAYRPLATKYPDSAVL